DRLVSLALETHRTRRERQLRQASHDGSPNLTLKVRSASAPTVEKIATVGVFRVAVDQVRKQVAKCLGLWVTLAHKALPRSVGRARYPAPVAWKGGPQPPVPVVLFSLVLHQQTRRF